MLFNSYPFVAVFLPITLVGYYLLGRLNHSAGLAWLAGASLVFYYAGAQANLLLIVASIVINFLAALAISRAAERVRFWLATVTIVANVGLIAFFKYSVLFVTTLNALTGEQVAWPAIVLPLGISFWTFQKIGYIADTYRSPSSAIRNVLKYIVFVLFFPQLIAGPIVHHKEIVPQLTPQITSRIDWNNIAVGLTIFIIGLTKKVLLADNVAAYSTPVFTAASDGIDLTALEALTGVLAWTLQIYFDFSGYSDMAIGLARLFGIKLPLNFNSPYKAASIVEFWRRWHMTLSRFLRDYLYIPLGGNRRGMIDRYANLMLTMLIGGLWHGAAWTFVVWGGLHGSYLVVNHLFIAARKRLWIPQVLPQSASRHAGRVLTFVAVAFSWIFFRAESWAGALNLVAALTSRKTAFPNHVIANPSIAWTWICALLLLVWLAPNTQEFMRHHEPAFGWRDFKDSRHLLAWNPSIGWAAVSALLVVACLLSLSQPSEFIYFNF
ncbi:MAG TPA: MBOAT family O-acyltransferase [Bradyrhizobium sp.]|jgi:alginate O-acetyltransferase complex protein AlgI|uniref:MBOAT family O-acyltransferase n=1 Tax=Bradyrhizobium sp. TaxID=376 RepID=UPI002CB046BD|nr:MBOAT family O-acyltransferase [Bradyrhizobium sp.]HTB01473.1 MBOAT family O-acyltransferase [Bradyrhizobium sp.]